MELREDRTKLFVGYPNTGVPDLDAQLVTAPSATEQDLAALGVLHRIRDQIAEHLFQEARIAPNAQLARNHMPAEAPGLRMVGEFDPQPLEQVVDREFDLFGVNYSSLELIDLEKSVQHAQHDIRCLVKLRDQF